MHHEDQLLRRIVAFPLTNLVCDRESATIYLIMLTSSFKLS